VDRSIRDGAPVRSALRLLVRRLCVTEVGFALRNKCGPAPSGPNSVPGPATHSPHSFQQPRSPY